MMKSWLIDTNVLIYSYDQACQFHQSSYDFITHSLSGELNLVVSHQNLLEFIAVVTNPNGIRQICTWNKKDFEKITEIHVKNPQEIVLSIKG